MYYLCSKNKGADQLRSYCTFVFAYAKIRFSFNTAHIFQYTDRKNPMDKHIMIMAEEVGLAHGPLMAQMFGNAGREHMEKYGTEL